MGSKKSPNPSEAQVSVVTARIDTINDVNTLLLISDVSEEDHPEFSYVATRRSKMLSMSDGRRAEVEAWMPMNAPFLDPQTNEVADVENMNVSELKHYVHSLQSLLSERQQLQKNSHELANPTQEMALEYVRQVKNEFRDQPEVYRRFIDILHGWKNKTFDMSGAVRNVAELFAGHTQLISGFNTFLPAEQLIDYQKNFSETEVNILEEY